MNFSSEHLQIDPTKEQVMGTSTFVRRRVIGNNSFRAVARCGVCAIVIAGRLVVQQFHGAGGG